MLLSADLFEKGAEGALVAQGLEQEVEGHCALRWLKPRLGLRRRREGRRRVCGAQYWRKGGSACSGDLRARFVRRSTRGAGGEGGAAKLFEQPREGLGSNIGFSAQRVGAAGANECSRAGLYDSAARSARAKRSRRRDNRQFGALLATDGAFAISQPHWRGLVELEDGAVRAENISTDKEGKLEALHNEQGMVHCDAVDFNGRVDVAAYLSAGASNADDVRCCASKRLNHESVAYSRVHGTAHHCEC